VLKESMFYQFLAELRNNIFGKGKLNLYKMQIIGDFFNQTP